MTNSTQPSFMGYVMKNKLEIKRREKMFDRLKVFIVTVGIVWAVAMAVILIWKEM